jgi:hypothetical protein
MDTTTPQATAKPMMTLWEERLSGASSSSKIGKANEKARQPTWLRRVRLPPPAPKGQA